MSGQCVSEEWTMFKQWAKKYIDIGEVFTLRISKQSVNNVYTVSEQIYRNWWTIHAYLAVDTSFVFW